MIHEELAMKDLNPNSPPTGQAIATGQVIGLGLLLTSMSALLQWCLDLPLSLSWPAHLPANTIPLLAGAYLVINLLGRSRSNTNSSSLWTCLVMLTIQWISFPWTNRGTEGWLWYALLSMSSICLVLFTWTSDNPWRVMGHRALITGGAGIMLMCCSSITHVTTLLAIAIPVVLIGILYNVKKWVFWPLADAWLLSALALLMANASIRFVEDPSAGLPEATILKSMVVVYLCSPLLYLGKETAFKVKMILSLLVMLISMIAGLWVYTHEGEAIDDSPSYDYGG